MGLTGALGESIEQLAYAISKDGSGKALRFNAAEVGHSAAYNRVAAAAKDIINTMGDEEAQAVRKIIKEGGDFSTPAFNDALNKMTGGDDAAKKIAKEFNELRAGYDTAKEIASSDSAKAVSAYAEFLGRDGGKLRADDAFRGYFLDKQHGGLRAKAALGAAAGVGVAGRLLSGGSLTRTNTGERDIAGIPFV
jgi:hypothetical protein